MTNLKLSIICVTTLLCFTGHDLIELVKKDPNIDAEHRFQQGQELLELLKDQKLLYGLQSAEVAGGDVRLSFTQQNKLIN